MQLAYTPSNSERPLAVHEIHNPQGLSGVVTDLGLNGVALVEVENYRLVKQAFETARTCLNGLAEDPDAASPHSIPFDASSAHATGYHQVGGMKSRSNVYREGFVFSNEQHSFAIAGQPNFQPQCQALYELLHDIAFSVLQAIPQHYSVGNNLHADIERQDHSQWHIKRYHRPTPISNSDDDPSLLWLPTHMDPSLISVVIHDRPNSSNGGAGLQYFCKQKWYEIPMSGHNIAIVFVGSVLPVFSPCRHRVRMTKSCDDDDEERMAATLFLRPSPTEKLKSGITFQHWLEKTARKYDSSGSSQRST